MKSTQVTSGKNVRREARKAAKQEAKKELAREGLGGFRSKDILPKVLPGALQDEVRSTISAIAAPKEAEPMRFVSEFTTEATALAHPYEVHDADFTSAGEAFCAAFRDPVRASVEFHQVKATTVYNALTVQDGVESTTFKLAATVPNNIVIAQNEIVYPNISRFNYVSGELIHGQVLGVGVSPQQAAGAIWLNSTADQISINVTALTGGTASLTPILFKWDGKNFIEKRNGAAITSTGITTTGLNADSDYGYYVLGFRNTGTAALSALSMSLSLIYTAGQFVYAHKMLPFLENHFLSVDDVRVNAYSLMLTNKAALINRSGQVAAVQSPGSIPWSTWNFSTVSSANNGKVLEAVNGIYIFGKPTMPSDFDYRDPVANNGVLDFKVSFPLDDTRSYVVVSANIPDAPAQDAYWTRSYGIEFLTSDQWYDRCRPEMNEDIFRQTLVIVRDLDAIHENPLHWKDVLNFAKKVANGVITYGPTVMTIAKLLAK